MVRPRAFLPIPLCAFALAIKRTNCLICDDRDFRMEISRKLCKDGTSPAAWKHRHEPTPTTPDDLLTTARAVALVGMLPGPAHRFDQRGWRLRGDLSPADRLSHHAPPRTGRRTRLADTEGRAEYVRRILHGRSVDRCDRFRSIGPVQFAIPPLDRDRARFSGRDRFAAELCSPQSIHGTRKILAHRPERLRPPLRSAGSPGTQGRPQ